MTNRRKPLRLIVARIPVERESEEPTTAYFLDTLECGHQQVAFFDFSWDEKGHMVNEVPKAKRHRCEECREAQIMPEFSLFPAPGKKAA